MNDSGSTHASILKDESVIKRKFWFSWALLIMALLFGLMFIIGGQWIVNEPVTTWSYGWVVCGFASGFTFLSTIVAGFLPSMFKRAHAGDGLLEDLMRIANGHTDILQEIKHAIRSDRGVFPEDWHTVRTEIGKREQAKSSLADVARETNLERFIREERLPPSD